MAREGFVQFGELSDARSWRAGGARGPGEGVVTWSPMFQRQITPGIELRLFEASDAQTVLAAVERNRDYLREWLPWVDLTHSAADVADFIERVREQFEAQQGPQCGIWI